MQYDTVRHSCHGLRLAPPVARRKHNYLQALIHHACKAGSPLLAGIFSVYSPLKKALMIGGCHVGRLTPSASLQ